MKGSLIYFLLKHKAPAETTKLLFLFQFEILDEQKHFKKGEN